ncbi:hypothetical protein R3P38DRAFT_3190754 [Favolaschia claudopus]|uniref:Uncharacterized protein n=1 Tax=Favolaschia claudopus TaxID=2862362 RepID=A0AAW0BMW2_9AGAR
MFAAPVFAAPAASYVLVGIQPTAMMLPAAGAYPVLLAPQPQFTAPAATAASPAPVPAKKDKEASKEAPKEAPKEAVVKTPGAGLPRALNALLRSEAPYRANEVYSHIPEEALAPVEEATVAPECALCEWAISGVPHCARKAYERQEDALYAFNSALTWGGVQIL